LDDFKKRIPSGSKFQVRSYSDIQVFEYYNSSNKRQWSVSSVGGLTIMSSSSFLVEEAIRFYSNGNIGSFYILMPSQSINDSSLGTLLLSGKGIASLIKGISSNQDVNLVGTLEMIAGAVALELSFEEEEIQFNGPVFLGDPTDFTPSIQANLAAISGLIPNEAREVTQINLGSIFQTQELVNRSFSGRSTLNGEIQRKLVDRGIFDSFTGELYLVELANVGVGPSNKVLLARTTNSQNALSLFSDFISEKSESTTDYYQEKTIFYISEEEFPAHLFKVNSKGFPKHLLLNMRIF
jgi:hypothetical protein